MDNKFEEVEHNFSTMIGKAIEQQLKIFIFF